MIVLKPLKRMMNEYKIILEKYEMNLDNFGINDYKKLIGEIKLFWYRNQKYVDYFITHITEEDEVAFLAGAVRLDVKSNGQFEYILVGKIRLINDPLLKMSAFYGGNEEEINFEYMNTYLEESIKDMLILFREYPDDFYMIPIEFIKNTEQDEYHSILNDVAERMVLSMFFVEYKSVHEFCKDNDSYEAIEDKLLPYMRKQLIFEDLTDINLPLRDRCNKYIKANEDIIPFISKMSEAKLFYMMVSQFCMQAIAIAMIMQNFHMIPFIRNDITFQYFTMIFHSNIMNDFSKNNYLITYIAYVLQKSFDFSNNEYQFVKKNLGNGKIINAIKNSFEVGELPIPNEIIKCAEVYLTCKKVGER